MAGNLTLTGERTLPGIWHENYWFRRHEAAYRRLLSLCAGATVLDAGCGEGYGADLVAGVARRMVGLDYDAATVAHAAAVYGRVGVARANLVALPLRSGGVDVVVSLQVIEHLWDQQGFLAEVARVLRPGGRLAVSTPNRLTFSPAGTVNPFHTSELSAAELETLLRHDFTGIEMAGVHHGRSTMDDLVAGQLADPPERWSAPLTAAVRAVTADDFEIRTDRIDASLDLLAVAVRR